MLLAIGVIKTAVSQGAASPSRKYNNSKFGFLFYAILRANPAKMSGYCRSVQFKCGVCFRGQAKDSVPFLDATFALDTIVTSR